MSLENVITYLEAQATFLAIGFGCILFALVALRIFEGASKAFDRIPVPTVQWPRQPNIPWERVSEPAKKVVRKMLTIVGVVVIGIVAPLSFALWLAQARVAVDPIAYVTASVVLSTFFVSIGVLYLLIKQRSTLRKMGAYMLLWYVIAISWLTAIIVALPMAFLSD